MNLRTYSLTEVAERTGISRATVYRAVASGQLPSVRIGSRRRVRETDLVAFLTPKPAAAVPVAVSVDAQFERPDESFKF